MYKLKGLRFITIIIFSIFLSILNPFLEQIQAQSAKFDNDANQLEDIGLIKINPDGSLTWQSFDLTSLTLTSLNTFGVSGDHLSIANWRDLNKLELGVIRLENNQIAWKILNNSANSEVTTFNFGTDNSYVLSGGDFNGNSYNDFAVAKANKKRLVFEIAFDRALNGDSGQVGSYQLGRVGDKVFYANTEGQRDKLGVLRSRQTRSDEDPRQQFNLLLLDVVTGQKTRVRIGRFGRLVKEIIPIKSTNVSDNFLVVGDNRFRLYDINGNVLYRGQKAESDIILVGDYLPDNGQEIAVVSTATNTVNLLNVFTNTRKLITNPAISGVPFDLFNVNQVGNIVAAANSCSEIRNPNDGGGGFVWKNSDFHPGMVLLTPANFNFDKVEIFSGSTKLSTLTYTGRHNENRQHWRDYSRDIAEYPSNSIVVGSSNSGEQGCWLIENTTIRND
jgi:hypothetical protein